MELPWLSRQPPVWTVSIHRCTSGSSMAEASASAAASLPGRNTSPSRRRTPFARVSGEGGWTGIPAPAGGGPVQHQAHADGVPELALAPAHGPAQGLLHHEAEHRLASQPRRTGARLMRSSSHLRTSQRSRRKRREQRRAAPFGVVILVSPPPRRSHVYSTDAGIRVRVPTFHAKPR
jgi:hypothetical protein